MCTASSQISSTRTRWDCPVCITEEHADMVERSRLMMEARKWYASKLAPKKYGDKIDAPLSALTAGRSRGT